LNYILNKSKTQAHARDSDCVHEVNKVTRVLLYPD